MNFLRISIRTVGPRLGRRESKIRLSRPLTRRCATLPHEFRNFRRNFGTSESPADEGRLQKLLKQSRYDEASAVAHRIIESKRAVDPSHLSLIFQALATQGIDVARKAIPRLKEIMETTLFDLDESIWKFPDLLIIASRGADASSSLSTQFVELINSGKVTPSSPNKQNVIDILIRSCTHAFNIDITEAALFSAFAAIRALPADFPMPPSTFVDPKSIQMVAHKAYLLRRPEIIERTFATSEQIGVKFNDSMYFYLLSAKCMKFEVQQVPPLLRTLITHQVPLQVETITVILRTCVTAANLDVAKSCWKLWKDAQLPVDSTAVNAFMLVVYWYGSDEEIQKLWSDRVAAASNSVDQLDAEAFNIAVRGELRRKKFDQALELLQWMQRLNFSIDNANIRYILREHMFDFSATPEITEAILKLSQALTGSAAEVDDSSLTYDVDRAIADSLPVYGSQMRIVEMQRVFDRFISHPDFYSVARLIEGYLLADALVVAYKYFEALLLPLLKAGKSPSDFEGAKLAAIAALTVSAKHTKSVDDFLATWTMIKSIPNFFPRTILESRFAG